MNFETEQPLEARLEQRLEKVSGEIKETTDRLRERGLSERAMAGYISTLEYINDLMTRVGLPGESKEDQELFITEIQSAVRTLTHGLTMGSSEERQEERHNIANGHGKLREEIAQALRDANGTGKKGGDETVLKTEHRL